MPLILWLATLLGSLFSGFIEFFAKYLTKKLAVVAAVIAAIGALTLGFFLSIYGLVSSIAYQMPPEISVAFSLVIPSNSMACVSAILSAHVFRWAYDWNVKVIQYRLF